MKNEFNQTFALLWVGLWFFMLSGCASGSNPEIQLPAPGGTVTATPSLSVSAPQATMTAPALDEVTGRVINLHGQPVANARVRQQTTENKTSTDKAGAFRLSGLPPGEEVVITAWSDGYYVGWTDTQGGSDGVLILLKPYDTMDNPDYDWFSTEGAEGSVSCSHCMPCYEEWIEDAHSQAAVNPRFLTMYTGRDINGNQSPPTRYVSTQDYGQRPLPPDRTKPYYGPGYQLDFPESAGNCAACHVPEPASHPGMEYNVDPTQVEGIALEGVFCELCHKVGAVTLDPDTDLPYANMPGILSMELYRPEEGKQIFFGNFDDVTRRVSYLPLMEESAYCAPCHFGVFWDMVIYDSYGEWLRSPYSDPENGQTCQDCHMLPVDYPYFVYPEQGGFQRNTERIYSHRMLSPELMQNALTLTAETERAGATVTVAVTLTNDLTGHDVPTDSPLRQLILLVTAYDDTGNPLELVDGPRVPPWGGEGDPEAGYFAGQPGKAYARILEETWTGISPTGAYWNPTRELSDNRLGAFESDTSHYTFRAPQGEVNVEVRLLYRRAFIELMDQKGWDVPDIVMEQTSLTIP